MVDLHGAASFGLHAPTHRSRSDASALDLVKYVGRRLGNVPVLLMLTYRDDDLGADHALRRLMGELPSTSTVRVQVPCLSRQAVDLLASRASRSAVGFFAATGGNPFFVTEVLSAHEAGLPPSVYDAVMARFASRSASARAIAELVSISPRHIERAVAEDLIDDAGSALDECVARACCEQAAAGSRSGMSSPASRSSTHCRRTVRCSCTVDCSKRSAPMRAHRRTAAAGSPCRAR